MSYHHERVKVLLNAICRYNRDHRANYQRAATLGDRKRGMGQIYNATPYQEQHNFLFSPQTMKQWNDLLASIDTLSDAEIIQIDQDATKLFWDMELDKVYPYVVEKLDNLENTTLEKGWRTKLQNIMRNVEKLTNNDFGMDFFQQFIQERPEGNAIGSAIATGLAMTAEVAITLLNSLVQKRVRINLMNVVNEVAKVIVDEGVDLGVNFEQLIKDHILGMVFEDAYKNQKDTKFNGYVLSYEKTGKPFIRRKSGHKNLGYTQLTVKENQIVLYIGSDRIADSSRLRQNMMDNKENKVGEAVKSVEDMPGVTQYFEKTVHDDLTNKDVTYRLYRVDGLEYEAHHLIPDQVYRKNAFFNKVRNFKNERNIPAVQYNIDRKSNGIFLPTDSETAKEHKKCTNGQMLPWHSGPHHEFSGRISRFAADMTATVTPNNAMDFIEEIENEARRIIFELGREEGKRLSFSQHDAQRYG
jgi:hypothetical protein